MLDLFSFTVGLLTFPAVLLIVGLIAYLGELCIYQFKTDWQKKYEEAAEELELLNDDKMNDQ